MQDFGIQEGAVLTVSQLKSRGVSEDQLNIEGEGDENPVGVRIAAA